MTTPERSNLVPLIDATKYFMDCIAQIEDEMDIILNHGRKIDIRKFRDLEKDFQAYSTAFDALTHGNNVRLVARFFQDQAEDLRTHAIGNENAEKIQELEYLATGLSPAA